MYIDEVNGFQEAGKFSDKVTNHGYQRNYPRLLMSLRGKKLKILEIGVQEGNSVNLWSEYFGAQSVEQVCVDIVEKELPDSVTFVRLDQSDETQLKGFVTSHRTFDLIVDDGSHVPCHQLLSLQILWDALVPGGIYIIEDIETSYWGNSRLYGYRFDANFYKSNTIRVLKDFVEYVNEGMCRNRKNLPRNLVKVAEEVESIMFGYNCILLVKKDPDMFSRFYGRKYQGADRYNRWAVWNILSRWVTGRK
jgi:hypothetical protein